MNRNKNAPPHPLAPNFLDNQQFFKVDTEQPFDACIRDVHKAVQRSVETLDMDDRKRLECFDGDLNMKTKTGTYANIFDRKEWPDANDISESVLSPRPERDAPTCSCCASRF
eukprot:COSAG02_NODE_5861_length_3981_cov_9.921175_4_plen_112_part_00